MGFAPLNHQLHRIIEKLMACAICLEDELMCEQVTWDLQGTDSKGQLVFHKDPLTGAWIACSPQVMILLFTLL